MNSTLELGTDQMVTLNFWDYRPVPPNPAYTELGTGPRALCISGEHFLLCFVFEKESHVAQVVLELLIPLAPSLES